MGEKSETDGEEGCWAKKVFSMLRNKRKLRASTTTNNNILFGKLKNTLCVCERGEKNLPQG